MLDSDSDLGLGDSGATEKFSVEQRAGICREYIVTGWRESLGLSQQVPI